MIPYSCTSSIQDCRQAGAVENRASHVYLNTADAGVVTLGVQPDTQKWQEYGKRYCLFSTHKL